MGNSSEWEARGKADEKCGIDGCSLPRMRSANTSLPNCHPFACNGSPVADFNLAKLKCKSIRANALGIAYPLVRGLLK